MAELTIQLSESEYDRLTEFASETGEPAPQLAARLVRTSLQTMGRSHASDDEVRRVMAASFRDREEVYRRLAE